MNARRRRVVRRATGNIGRRAPREVIRHPALELVGVRVDDPATVDVDAIPYVCMAASGILSTTDLRPITMAGPPPTVGANR